MCHSSLEVIIRKSEKELLALEAKVGARDELIKLFFNTRIEVPCKFVRVLLTSLREALQQVARELQNYSSCILQTTFCMTFSFRFQDSYLNAMKLRQTTANTVFCLADFPKLPTGTSNCHFRNRDEPYRKFMWNA